jgi:predicted  nucleic acid-binding Zn-ribbon protein
LRVSDLTGDVDRVQSKYETQLNGMTDESNEQRDRAITLEKELDEAKKEIELLEGETADLNDTVEAMEKNMVAVRADFSSRMDAAREETTVQTEEYEGQLEKLQNELDAKKKESREVVASNEARQTRSLFLSC